MNPAVLAYYLQKSCNISVLQLCKRTVFGYQRNYRVLVHKAFKHLCVCGIACFCLFGTGEHQLFKKHASELFGRAYIEFIACVFINFTADFFSLFANLFTESLYTVCVNTYALTLHSYKHSGKRYLYIGKDCRRACFTDFAIKYIVEGGNGYRLFLYAVSLRNSVLSAEP